MIKILCNRTIKILFYKNMIVQVKDGDIILCNITIKILFYEKNDCTS